MTVVETVEYASGQAKVGPIAVYNNASGSWNHQVETWDGIQLAASVTLLP